MIEIGFKYNEAPNRTHKETYVLTVEYMHGDADGTTYETRIYPLADEERLKQDLLGIITFTNSQAEFDEAAEEIAPIFEAQGIEDAFGEAEAWADNFREGDITCDGNSATLVGYELAYFDDAGKEYAVDLTVNGKLVA